MWKWEQVLQQYFNSTSQSDDYPTRLSCNPTLTITRLQKAQTNTAQYPVTEYVPTSEWNHKVWINRETTSSCCSPSWYNYAALTLTQCKFLHSFSWGAGCTCTYTRLRMGSLVTSLDLPPNKVVSSSFNFKQLKHQQESRETRTKLKSNAKMYTNKEGRIYISEGKHT